MNSLQLKLVDCLSSLDADDWDNIKKRSKSKILWLQLEWWQNKYYRDNPPNDGSKIQIPRLGNPEVPYRRQIFYPSIHSRFSLGAKVPVAYFSSDFVVNCCETIEQFSAARALSWNELSPFLAGESNPTPGWYGYPLNYHLLDDSLILDLSQKNGGFLSRIQHKLGQDTVMFLWQLFRSRSKQRKSSTQIVAVEAHRRGFDGIVYASVRAPIDVVLPTWNLVMLNPNKVREGKLPRNRFPRTGASYLAWQSRYAISTSIVNLHSLTG
jgi:hypothetical protein